MEQVQEHSQQQTNPTFTLSNGVALAIVFGGSPALFLSFLAL